jgi:hypothetical protein
MKRHKHSLSHYKLLTCDMGQLVPIGCMEVLPGDTFQHATSLLVRMSPLLAPVMHPVTIRVHHWFVPNRLIWDDWEDFITGGPDGTGAATPYPTNGSTVTVTQGSVWDYLGVPVNGTAYPIGRLSTIPLHGYNKIFNEFYRDEDLVAEVAPDTATVQKIAWEKDYFTSARPWAQKGPAVTIPLGSTAKVLPGAADHTTSGMYGMNVRDTATGNYLAAAREMGAGASGMIGYTGTGVTLTGNLYPSNLYADLAGATGADVIAFRQALAIQRYQEARAQYGSRYTEYLRYLGIRSSDARLQRPEYLGGGKQTVAFSEVLQTGTDATYPVGTMRGHGIAALRSNRYRYFAEEHGYILSLLSMRPRSIYTNGLPRTFSRRTKEDYYQKELELIGQQEIKKNELYQQMTAADLETWGYQNRYQEYRHQYSSIAGEFRTTLDYWHMARILGSMPTLNGSFVTCDPAKRVFASSSTNSAWIMASHSVQVRRMVGHQTIGRIM